MEQFLSTPFTEPSYFGLLTGIIFIITFLRYLLVSGVYHFFFHRWFRATYKSRLINPSEPDYQQVRMEIWRSMITSVIFAFSGTFLVILWQQGYTKLYYQWSQYPWWYHPISVILVLLIQETYYYWLHRWMHLPKIYRLVHKWHHDSIKTSALTAFSFHPIESILQAIVLPILILVLPLHLYLLFFLLILMTLSSTINHAGVEIFPKGSASHWFGRWLVGATHHDLHHKQFRFNYGLYFTFWDKWMDTESPKFEDQFKTYTDSVD